MPEAAATRTMTPPNPSSIKLLKGMIRCSSRKAKFVHVDAVETNKDQDHPSSALWRLVLTKRARGPY